MLRRLANPLTNKYTKNSVPGLSSRVWSRRYSHQTETDVHEIYDLNYKHAHLSSRAHYDQLYNESIQNPNSFWEKMAKQNLSWFRTFDSVTEGSLDRGNVSWFAGGALNVSYNCIDRHLPTKAHKKAIIWEGDDPKDTRSLTYQELHDAVSKFANALKDLGLQKGDRASIYMPMVPEAMIAMLACSRIGVVHTVVFGGFSATSVANRINNSKSKVLITANEGLRGGKVIPLKKIADEALSTCPTIQKVIVFKRTNTAVDWNKDRDVWWHEIVKIQKPYCPPAHMDSEDSLFLLYTSGSTGQPKGMEHTTAGYLLYATLTFKYVFDVREDDIMACTADVGWITGHSYLLYAPLSMGITTLCFESIPSYPTPSRFWDLVERHKVTTFYTAPTAIRSLMGQSDDWLKGKNMDSLRVLGTVGEPINPAAWRWYFHKVGKARCPIVDTYWQTETGGIVVSPLPGICPMKPGAAMLPFFGVKPEVLDPSGYPRTQNDTTGVLAFSTKWPGMARTVFGNHEKYMDTYFRPYPGFYFTGDGCLRDNDGHYWVTGRVDDVINKAGHRIGSAEIESALVAHSTCSEAAVITIPDDVMGEKIIAFCSLSEDAPDNEETVKQLKQSVSTIIGKFAAPDKIVLTTALPKTRSGKIMRRILRKLMLNQTSPEDLGDVSTLADPDALKTLISKVKGQ